MPHVSKHPLKEEIANSIYKEFRKTLLTLKYRKVDSPFLDEFFTNTERIMLAKRLAIIALLLRGMSPYRIQKTLMISPSTIARLQLKLERGKLKRVEEILRESLELKGFWEKIETLLEIALPPRGKGRWKFLTDNASPQ
ncbi:MAG: Trp family transcriptional regulator [Patescibacteria group bacterium]